MRVGLCSTADRRFLARAVREPAAFRRSRTGRRQKVQVAFRKTSLLPLIVPNVVDGVPTIRCAPTFSSMASVGLKEIDGAAVHPEVLDPVPEEEGDHAERDDDGQRKPVYESSESLHDVSPLCALYLGTIP